MSTQINFLSVVIPCYGHRTELELCLRALDAQRTDSAFEVIVVDSTPAAEAFAWQADRVKLIRSRSRLFPGEARNRGVREAAGANLAFLDADCVPCEDWIQRVSLALQAGYVLVGGPILDAAPRNALAWVDNRLQFSDFQAGRPAGPGSHFPTCNMALRREVFDALGGFDEGIHTGEDAVFSGRAVQRFADRMWFQPGMTVYHHGRDDAMEMRSHQQLLGYYRGRLGLAITPAWKWLARSPWLGSLAVLRRLAYISMRTWQYDRRGLLRLVLCLPLVLSGLLAWTRGFYEGVHDTIPMENKK